jgi:hypothetical protein
MLQLISIKPSLNLEMVLKKPFQHEFPDGLIKTVYKTIILDCFENRLEKNQLESTIFFVVKSEVFYFFTSLITIYYFPVN